MYATCLFCHAPLGANEAVEHFPVGRRLAFDAAKGRLWVVCGRCERWNLTPLEERWEAIEECERLFRDARLKAQTDNVGMTRLREGLELVRIGKPARPELAAWRYGARFGRRHRRRVALIAGSGVAMTAAFAGFWTIGLPAASLATFYVWFHRATKLARGDAPSAKFRVATRDAYPTYFLPEEVARFSIQRDVSEPGWSLTLGNVSLTGAEALQAAGLVLPIVNRVGASERVVQRAVDAVDALGHADRFVREFVPAMLDLGANEGRRLLSDMRPADRLALEMALHEESERRAMQGELAALEQRWKEAEEIAAIADELLLPERVRAAFSRLRGR